MSPYRPIPCAQHERLEFAALTRQWLDVELLDGAHVGLQRVLPHDVVTRDGAEWLVAETADGVRLTVRLDALRF